MIGIEYMSGNHRFSKQAYGNMKEATAGLKDVPFKILLSHDPSHWNAEVTNKYKDMDLTLAGHTHGAQFGVEIPGVRWSSRTIFLQAVGRTLQPRQTVYLREPWIGIYRLSGSCWYSSGDYSD